MTEGSAQTVGRTLWVIPEGYIPGTSTGEGPDIESHETACILNAGDSDAHLRITLYFADRDPAGPYEVSVAARRTLPFASTSSTIRSRSHATPTTPRYSKRTYL